MCVISRVVLVATGLGLAGLTAALGEAGFRCCQLCGCQPCEKVCRLVCEEKKVNVVCWGVRDEDFCIPGCSERGCQNCENVCDEGCDPEQALSRPKRFVWYDWSPKTAPTLHTRRKLLKKTVVKKIPSYKWVVQDLCQACAAQCTTKPAESDDRVEPKGRLQSPAPKAHSPRRERTPNEPAHETPAQGKSVKTAGEPQPPRVR